MAELKASSSNIVPVILCGGSGTRLWPLSRENAPKQFLKLMGKDSLLTQTLDRAMKCSGASADHVVTVTLDALKKKTIMDMGDYDIHAINHVLGEPAGRNTAAAIAYAAMYVNAQFGGDAIMWILPADHFVGNNKALSASLNQAATAAAEGMLVTFGMKPTRAETGYGYIKTGKPTMQNGVMSVDRFVEKPDKATAEEYLRSGDYLWNSGMFVFRADAVLAAFRKYAPEILAGVEHAVNSRSGMKTVSLESYQAIPSQPFDIAIMEKTDRAAVVPCDIGWSDIGSWESVWENNAQDSHGNVMQGRVACVDTKNSLIQSSSLLVAAIGLRDVVIIENGDSVLIADKKNPDAMKTLVTALKKAGTRETIDPPMEERPWGSFRVLSYGAGYKIKEIVVKPGQKLSLQMHHHRCEFWTVISGEAIVQIDDSRRHLKAQENAFIPLHAKHRLENPGTTDMVMVEVQCGDYLGEDDIVRFDDIYGRAAA